MRKNHDSNAVSNRSGQLALIAWVGFIAACALEGLVFSVIDPGEIHWSGHMPQPTRQGIYAVAFFCFWLISMACAGLALWLAATPSGFNGTAAD